MIELSKGLFYIADRDGGLVVLDRNSNTSKHYQPDIYNPNSIGAKSLMSIIRDMSGNIWEWCLNEFDDPTKIGLTGNASRVARGGSFEEGFKSTRCMYRHWGSPIRWFKGVGFRVMCKEPAKI